MMLWILISATAMIKHIPYGISYLVHITYVVHHDPSIVIWELQCFALSQTTKTVPLKCILFVIVSNAFPILY